MQQDENTLGRFIPAENLTLPHNAPNLDRSPLIAIDEILLAEIRQSKTLLPVVQEKILIRILCTSVFQNMVEFYYTILSTIVCDFIVTNKLEVVEVEKLEKALKEGQGANLILLDYLNVYLTNKNFTDFEFINRRFNLISRVEEFSAQPLSEDDTSKVVDFFLNLLRNIVESSSSVEETSQGIKSHDYEAWSPYSVMLQLINGDSLWLRPEARNRLINMLEEETTIKFLNPSSQVML
ncbi:hypothetical protein [Coxiella burnetii]|uniref:hypothetical protein n=1 Tax=Coxiella burnetii TaxID=777 RepID=UPI0021AE62C0|nr:hypothetical protein [Coxiella burnetii]